MPLQQSSRYKHWGLQQDNPHPPIKKKKVAKPICEEQNPDKPDQNT